MTKLSPLRQGRNTAEDGRTIRTLNDDLGKNVEDILTPEQSRRFEQIQLQFAGVYALTVPNVENALKLTDDQKAKIREIIEALETSIKSKPVAKKEDTRRSGGDALRSAKGRRTTQLSIVLTDNQKKAWANIIGASV